MGGLGQTKGVPSRPFGYCHIMSCALTRLTVPMLAEILNSEAAGQSPAGFHQRAGPATKRVSFSQHAASGRQTGLAEQHQ